MNVSGSRHFILSIVAIWYRFIYFLLPPGILQKKQQEVSGMEDEYADLAQAVVMQAVEDYRRARRILRRRPDHTRACKAAREVEGFFRSAWFMTLTGLDGGEILDKLKGDGI